MTEKNQQVKVGAVFVISIALLVGGILWFKNFSFRTRHETVLVGFPSASGLIKGDPVEVSGVPSGQVARIEFRDGRAVVELNVDDEIKLYQDARISIDNVGIMGQKMVSIQPGTTRPEVPLAGTVFEGHYQPGMTELMTDLGGTLAAFERMASRLDNMIAAVTSDEQGSLRRTLANTEELTGEMAEFLRASKGDLAASVRSFRLAMDDVHRVLDGREDDLQKLMVEATRVSVRLDSTLVQFGQTLDRVHHVVQGVEEGDGTMGRLFADEKLYEEMISTLTETRALVMDLKANPKEAVYGNAGAGGHAHFVGTKLSQAIGVPLLSIPYKGNGPVNIDLVGGQLPAAILPASDLMQHRNNPKLQILGLFEKTRSPLVPEVPTFAEQGLNIAVGQAWKGMWTTAKTPKAEIEKIENALRKVLADPGFKEALMTRFTMFPMFHTAAETDKLQRDEIELWRPIIKASGFTPDQ